MYKNCFILVFIIFFFQAKGQDALYNKVRVPDALNLSDTLGIAGNIDSVSIKFPGMYKAEGSDSVSNILKRYLKTGVDENTLKELQGERLEPEKLNLESISTESYKSPPLDSLLKDVRKAKDFQDTDQLQEAFGSEFQEEFDGELPPLATDFKKGAITKRVLSVDDRKIVDSIRSLGSEKLYSIRDEVQDSVGMYLLSEKKKLKENLFFEGLVSTETFNGDLSVSDFSGSLGVRLRKFYEVGMGPEIGVSGNEFSAIGARLFARRRIFEDKLFAIVENSFRKRPDFGEPVPDAEGMVSNLKLGAGRMFNLSPNGRTRLNIQTLVNPQYLKTGHSSLVDFRFGISKLSGKQ